MKSVTFHAILKKHWKKEFYMSDNFKHLSMGWLPDFPSYRDYTEDTPLIAPLIAGTGASDPTPKTVTDSVDLREWCSPIEDQGSIGSCTAHAGVGLIEFYERKAFGKHIDASRLFLYKTTRNLLQWTGDTGAFIRSTMGAMVLFGAPPEKYWPYVTDDYDKEPPAFCYAYASNYQTLSYYRLDPPLTARDQLLRKIKSYLASGMPSMFGFTIFSSISQAVKTGEIPYPQKDERTQGGHAVVAVGYDDNRKIVNSKGKVTTTGAILIRNSWGTSWGDEGYGWLPYDYILKGLAVDWWSVIKKEWVDTGEFQLKN